MTDVELDDLVAQVQGGNEDVFADLVFAIRKELRIFISAHASSVDMVEEVLQSTLVACYENIQKYERRGTFLSWTKGIARNLILKELTARARYVSAEADVLERLVVDSALETAGARRDRAEEWVDRLKCCIEKLPASSRELVEKRYYQRMSIRSLSRVMDRPENALAVTLFRIRDALRECMMKEVAE